MRSIKSALSMALLSALVLQPLLPLTAYAQSAGVNQAPAASTVSGPTTGAPNSSYTFTATSVDPEGDQVNYGFDWDNDGIVDGYTGFVASGVSAQLAHTWTADGTYAFNVQTKDINNGLSSWTTATIVIATPSSSGSGGSTPPVVVNTAPNVPTVVVNSSVQVNTALSFSATALDPQGDQVNYGFDWNNDGVVDIYTGFVASGISAAASNTWTTPGNYTVQVYAKDINGAVSNPQSVLITVSAPPVNLAPATPTVTVSGANTVNSTITLTATAVDPEGDQVNYGFDWDNDGVVDVYSGFVGSGVSAQQSHSWPAAGTYTVTVIAKDFPNHISNSASVSVTIVAGPAVIVNTAPNAPVVVVPSTGTINTAISFSISAVDPQNDQISYGFDWDNDGVVDVWTSPVASGISASVSHTFTAAGNFIVKAYAKDNQGAISSSVSSSIAISGGSVTPPGLNLAPYAPTVAPASGTVNSNISLTATAVDPEGDQVNYGFDWDNDGVIDAFTGVVNSGVAASLAHAWGAPGVYTVPVFARDMGNHLSPATPVQVTVTTGPVVITNTAPNIPNVVFSATGLVNVPVSFSVSATDPQGDNVKYGFDWDNNGSIDFLTPFVASGISAAASNTWTAPGNYTVQIYAIDSSGAASTPFASTIAISGSSSPTSAAISSFTLTPSTISSGGTSTIAWSSQNATLCVASGAWSGSVPVSGSQIVGPFTSTANTTLTFTLNCGNSTATTTQSVVLSVNGSNGSGGGNGGGGGGNGGGGSSGGGTGSGGSSGGSGGGSYNGPCFGYNCPAGGSNGAGTSTNPIPNTIWIQIGSNSGSTGGSNGPTGPELVCPSVNFITQFLRAGADNNPNEVRKLQYFLNVYENAGLAIDGDFGSTTEAAVKSFQVKYASDILAPWGVTEPTGIVYITTSKKINLIFCADHLKYSGNQDLKDILDGNVFNTDNSGQFGGAIGYGTTSSSTLSNIAGVLGAMSQKLLDALRAIPLYQLLIILLLLLGIGFTIQGTVKKDIQAYETYLSFMRGMAVLVVASVLNVLNTLSFMLNPEWLSRTTGLSLQWVLGLDIANAAAMIIICLAVLIALYGKIAGLTPKK